MDRILQKCRLHCSRYLSWADLRVVFSKKLALCKTDCILAKADAFLDELNILPYFDDREDVQRMLTRHWDYNHINTIIEGKRKQSVKFQKAAIGE